MQQRSSLNLQATTAERERMSSGGTAGARTYSRMIGKTKVIVSSCDKDLLFDRTARWQINEAGYVCSPTYDPDPESGHVYLHELIGLRMGMNRNVVDIQGDSKTSLQRENIYDIRFAD